jgi:hypothetical protein
VLGVALVGFLAETGRSMADIRQVLMDGRGSMSELVVQHAVERGEVDPAVLTPRLISLPMDLFRNELVMTLAPVSQQTILEIVDAIYLPLILRKNLDESSGTE